MVAAWTDGDRKANGNCETDVYGRKCMRSSQVQGNPGEGSDHWEVRAMGAMEKKTKVKIERSANC
jgi:hypothetical protein